MHLLILGKIWPEPASSAAGSRLLQLIGLFKEEGWQLSFASTAHASDYSANLALEGIATYSISLNDASFDDFIKQLRPDAVLFDRFTTEEQFGWRITEHCPEALQLLDTEDLHGLRFARQQALKQQRTLQPEDLLNKTALRELASIYRCDLSLIISSHEITLLEQFFKVDTGLLHYIPFLIETNSIKFDHLPAFNERRNFISIGNFLHAPNLDAVLYLKEMVWPHIRQQLPQAQLEVYGAYVPEQVLQLHHPGSGFLVKGRADSVNEVMGRARLCLAPLRFGAGLKGKLLDAMLNGTPSVSTPVGAEGMHADLPWCGAIGDTPTALAEAAVYLYTNESVWLEAQKQGTKILSACFDKNVHGPIFKGKIQELLQHRSTRRLANVTGAMLRQQTTAATKYMALWIEAKNKLME